MKTSTREALSPLLIGHRSQVVLMSLTSVLGGLAEAVFLVVITRASFAITKGQHIMGVLAGRSVTVTVAMLIALALVMVRIAMAMVTNWYSAVLSSEITYELRGRLSRAYLRSSWAAQQDAPGGRLQELVSSYAGSGANLVGSFSTVLIATFSVGSMLLLAVGVDPVGSLVSVAAVAVLGSALRPVRHRVQQQARVATKDGMALATEASEVSGLGMVMHVFDARGAVQRRVETALHRSKESSRKLNLLRGMVPSIYSGLAYLVLVGAVAMASLSDTASLTSLGAVMLVMLRSLSYGQQVQTGYSGIHTSIPQVMDVYAEIDKFEAQAFVDTGDPVEAICPLVLDHVSFHYVEGQPVLTDVSAEIAERELVGIVGPSGSGKSTLVQLLLGLREPTEGRVLAAHKDIRSLQHSSWARKVTFVPQTPVLVTGTISENIRFYRDDVADDDIERAAKLSGLHDEIVAFPDGYLHQVGDRGGRLSGGQQQRLCIARALVGQPEVLILDEPTSALDARSESLIRDTIDGLREHMTVLVIAHRLSTIEQCDRIMVIQHGQIAAFDTPAALRAANNNFYAEAVKLSGLA